MDFVKCGFINHGLVRGRFVNHGLVRGGFVNHGLCKRWIYKSWTL